MDIYLFGDISYLLALLSGTLEYVLNAKNRSAVVLLPLIPIKKNVSMQSKIVEIFHYTN